MVSRFCREETFLWNFIWIESNHCAETIENNLVGHALIAVRYLSFRHLAMCRVGKVRIVNKGKTGTKGKAAGFVAKNE